jgi:hypothetical protein
MRPPTSAAAGFSVHTGWAASVVVAGTLSAPVVLDRRRVALAPKDEPGDNQVFHAAENRPIAEARRIIAAAERASLAAAREGLAALEAALRRASRQDRGALGPGSAGGRAGRVARARGAAVIRRGPGRV